MSSIPIDLATQYFADHITRDVIANRPDPSGILIRQGEVYVCLLPEYATVFGQVVSDGFW
ncbi:MAG: hypothetical protein FWE34_03755 [Defluviitaleaceae bacterium]|nr:hypothetical protein [Defluviitaleaceae bacterium]